MRIKLDENLTVKVSEPLIRLGHDVDTVAAEGLIGRDDSTVWTAAQRDQRFFVTQDLRFSDARSYPPGSHCGVLLLRLRLPDQQVVIERVRELFEHENCDDWKGCIVVATERKLRILSPPAKS